MSFDTVDLIERYLSLQDWQVKENSNMNYSLQGMNNYIVSALTTKYWLEKVYPEKISQAHLNGDFHIHDLNLLAPYCCGWDLRDLLIRGFGGVEQKVESKPAKHFRVALMQVVNFFYTLQGEAAGAQAFSNFDTFLAPFIAYDRLSYSDVVQCMQEFIFNLNVPTRVGFQTPFVNITMDVVVPKYLAREPVIIGGEFQDKCYGDFQKEMDMLNKAFCEIMLQGDAKGRIFSFPIPTYNISHDFPWDSEVAEMILRMTSKYGVPYFANFISSGLAPEDVRSMCCRLRLDNRELRKRGGGLFGANPMTGSVGVVTINMPRLGYLSNSVEEFFERLSDVMDLAKESLIIKRGFIERLTEIGLYPYSRVCLKNIKEFFGQYWHNHFSTIGLIGMHEALMNLFGKGIDTEEGRDFAIKVLDFMRTRLIDYQKETGNLFNLEATPAEGTSYRLAKIDKQRFGDIFTNGDIEPFYTNSTQLPVGQIEDLFEALQMQEELQIRYTGGTVFHIYLGEQVEDPMVIGLLIKRIFENYRLPYITITPTFSICQDHGYLSGEHYNCPVCGRATEVWSRVVGFYRPVQNWNPGKQEEFKFRDVYKIHHE
ncbi:ribonucleoside triphosphate reductase [Thermotoga profunda]|uniref:ribonucleoside triphosphate reductase n=1 Tax=Thermotoga profunda TaxID=1508420 RepID=UPI000596C3CA|nr:ribonucleoside triphosphate reductase [Thermotoga profunda]